MTVTGTLTFVDVSGGFWGILGDDGSKYAISEGLPASYKKEGMRVKAKVSPSASMSIFMWGQNVNIEEIYSQ